MHIPDGYLSPSTCAALYGAAAPFWYIALKRVARLLASRLIPLISVFAAFSFVIMMFNLPLPGGTTGHAIGVGIAAIALGPWASMLAISIALVIQAIFFGDGGITAIGANCFNMAIVGSIVAYAVYRLIGLHAALTSSRRVIAAGIAGYTGINAAALFAAVEFGIQPLLFRDPSGAPLYCPYPLSISIPAMMIGHLTFAGMAELIITGGVVAYLQRADPSLLKQTAPDAPDRDEPLAAAQPHWPTARKLWAALAVLLILTPLGILAGGSAWGEWSSRDFNDSSVREHITAASGNRVPPQHSPRGLERLSFIWRAPISRYAPTFVRNAFFGYFVSASMGVGLIILFLLALGWALARGRRERASKLGETSQSPLFYRTRGFVERTLSALVEVTEHALYAEDIARTDGFLQRFDARVKLAGLLALIIAVVATRKFLVLVGIFAVAILMAVLSRIPVRMLATKIWIAAFTFTALLAIPAVFVTPGDAIWSVPLLGWHATTQGLSSAGYLILRVETAATLSALLIWSTPWTKILRSLRFCGVPVVLVVILGMTYRYIFLLLQAAHDMFESRRSRLIGTLPGSERRRLAAGTAGVLLGKSIQLSSEVHLAMQARGFSGEVRLLDDLKMRPADWLRLAALLVLAASAVWLGT
jgi:cobalt/nickel transport system permease protein